MEQLTECNCAFKHVDARTKMSLMESGAKIGSFSRSRLSARRPCVSPRASSQVLRGAVTQHFIWGLSSCVSSSAKSLFERIAAGVEKFMKERSDDAILVFPLLWPPPSCHNSQVSKWKGVAESWALQPVRVSLSGWFPFSHEFYTVLSISSI